MPNKLAVSAGITIVSYRGSIFGDEGLAEVWQNNGSEELWRRYEQKGINPTSISDAQWDSEVNELIKANPYSDLRTLRDCIPGASWSAPKQNLLNGVLFFYIGDQRPRLNVNKCLNEATAANLAPSFVNAIHDDKVFIDKYARTLFGMAPVTGIASYGQGSGFRGRIFADIASGNLIYSRIHSHMIS